MTRMIVAGGVIAGLTMAASAQQPAPPPPASAAPAVQQAFVAAAALDAGTDPGAAVAAWTALEERTKPGSRNRAIVQVRKGAALFRAGRFDAAQAATRMGLDALPAADATLREDRLRGTMILGRIAADTLDYAGAAAAYAAAEPLMEEPASRLLVLIALAGAQTFVDPAAAAATLDRADAIATTIKPNSTTTAMLARRRTILLLNAGDFAGAQRSATRAVSLLGGLTELTDLNDVSARSDAAIAYLLGGQAEEARRYMALTGAGRLPKGSFDPAAEMVAPDCGGEAGLRPEDVAVVEFSIAPDGTVSRAVPIYAAGGGKVALEYARAVRGWAWSAEAVAALPPFFRNNARVEMRCSTAFTRPSIGSGLDARLEQWLEGKGVTVPPAPEPNFVAALPLQRAALAAAEAKDASSLETLAALFRLANNYTVPREERAAFGARALVIATANGAPPPALLTLDLPARLAAMTDPWGRGSADRTVQLVQSVLAQPVYAGDPTSRAAIRLFLADMVTPVSGSSSKRREGGDTSLLFLRQVADDPELRKDDPLRVGALVRIASIEQNAGNIDKARAAFEASGITASQCAVLDSPPRLLSQPDSTTFPGEAARWGFEGWVQVQYDVGANGRTRATRALLSYPPFIFSAASTKFFDAAQFTKTYRPDGELGCGGVLQRIRYVLPGEAKRTTSNTSSSVF